MAKPWPAAVAGPAAEQQVDAYRDRAAELDAAAIADLEPRVQQAPQDSWVVLPLAEARIRRAIAYAAKGERTAADALLAPALAALESARAEAFADHWDEDLFVRARAIAAQLASGK